jgi:hypothetical protein
VSIPSSTGCCVTLLGDRDLTTADTFRSRLAELWHELLA